MDTCLNRWEFYFWCTFCLKTQKTKTTYGYGVVDKANTTDDDRGQWLEENKGYMKLQSKEFVLLRLAFPGKAFVVNKRISEKVNKLVLWYRE